MATHTRPETYDDTAIRGPQIEPPNEIIIERREVIATVTLDPHGREPAVKVAFDAVRDYIGHNADDGLRLEFTFQGLRFGFTVDETDAMRAAGNVNGGA